MGRAIVAVISGVVSAFVVILLVEAVGAMVAPAGVAPDIRDTARMRDYLATLPWSASAFVLAAYVAGSAAGAWIAGRIAGNPGARSVWVVAAMLGATTLANLVLVTHPLWFAIATVVAIFAGTVLAIGLAPAARQSVR